MRPRLIPLLLLVPLLSAAPAAAQKSRTFTSQTGGFQVEVPADWSQVPDRMLDRARAQSDPEDQITYVAGFEAGGSPWPAPPVAGLAYMALERRYTVEEFREEFAGADAQEEMQSGIDQTPAAELGGLVNAPRWDAENGIAWVRMALATEGAAPAFAWTATTLHPGGRAAVMLVYYGARGQDEAAVRAQLLGVLQSLRVP